MDKRDSIFIAMNNGFGPLAQILPIVDELKKNNYHIILHNCRAAADMVKKMGFEYFELPCETVKPDRVTPNTPDWWNADYLYSKYGYLDYRYVKCYVDIFTRAFEFYKPKAVISMMYPTATIAARRLGIPLISVTQACLHNKGRGGRTTWWKELPRNLERTSPVVNRVLRELGLKPISKMEDLNDGDLTIVPSIPEFDVIESNDVIYTGLMFWQGPEELTDVEFNIKRKNRYLIFVYTGHLYNSGGGATGMVLLKEAVKAFNNTEFDVILSTGTGQELPNNLETAENITISEWVPVNKVIPQCDLMIHHGGHGCCLQSIGHGVPSLVIPTMDEREYNARQLYDMGVGLFILPEELNPELLLTSARAMVNDRKMKEKARSCSEFYRDRKDGPATAARKIMELIRDI